MTVAEIYALLLECSGVSIDSRTILPGELFIGITGPNFNGNQYALDALKNGAKYAIVSDQQQSNKNIYYYAGGGTELLKELALIKRRTIDHPVVALTGSNGKTTTKELLHAVLSTRYKAYATEGNLNNHLGVPLTILRAPSNIDMLVVEMGANHQQEIAYLSDIAQPTVGLITNIGKAHLEGFGGEEGVYKGKKELFDYLARTNGMAFVNADDQKVLQASQSVQDRKLYSLASTFASTGITASNTLSYQTSPQSTPIVTQLTGDYNLQNIAAAICVGRHFHVPEESMHQAISTYLPTNHRSQLIPLPTGLVVMDAYNANPNSMLASLKNLTHIAAPYPKQAILGEMLELGEACREEHQRILDYCQVNSIKCILVGTAWKLCNLQNIDWYPEVEDLNAKPLLNGHTTLLKGSRGGQLEKLLDQIQL